MTVALISVVALSLSNACVRATLYHVTPQPLNPHKQPLNRVPKQTQAQALVLEDQNPAAQTQLGAEHGGHGKYFMDTVMIQTGPKQLEFGHVCEDPNEWEQRYERQDQEKRRYQGKARWGDKHGGYGEHYWDYNHGGHHGDDGGSNDEGGEESDPVADYQINEPDQDDRVKRAHDEPPAAASERHTSASLEHQTPRHASASASSVSEVTDGGIHLAYDVESGTIVDEATGQRYQLTPIN